MIRVLVSGAAGRMGREVVKAVAAESDMEIVAVVDTGAAGTVLQDVAGSFECSAELDAAIASSSPDVMVDFTRPDAVAENVRVAASAGVDSVVGTTGVESSDLGTALDGAPDGTSVFVAPNFAIGAVLLMRFAREAAAYLPHVEIIELHHDQKLDAPSGTALMTARLISGARGAAPEAPGVETEVARGARGASVDDVSIHSVRLPGLVAHQEVLFGGQGQTLSLRHDSIDRSSFMPGVVMAVRASSQLDGLVVGLESILGS